MCSKVQSWTAKERKQDQLESNKCDINTNEDYSIFKENHEFRELFHDALVDSYGAL